MFPGGTGGKELICQCRRLKRCRFSSWVGKIPWRRKWQPTPVFLPGKFHAQRSLGATVHGLAKGQTWLKRLNMHTTCDLYFLLWDALPFKLSYHPSKNVLFKIKVYQRKVTCYQKNLSVISKPGNRQGELFCFEQCIRLSSTFSLPVHS